MTSGPLPHEREPQVRNGVCLRCGSGVIAATGKHIRDDLPPCFGAPPVSAGSQEPAPANSKPTPNSSKDLEEPAPAERDERTWTLIESLNGKYIGPALGTFEQVEVVPRSELQRVQGQLDQAREALKPFAVRSRDFAGYAPHTFIDLPLRHFLAAEAALASGVTETGDGE